MRILLVGGRSALAQELRPVLAEWAEVLTAGRNSCDLVLDLTWAPDRFRLPPELDAVIQLAAHFGGSGVDAMLAAEETNALGTLKLAAACNSVGVRHLVLVSSLSALLDEASPYYNSYSMSKRHAEELVRMYCRSVDLPLAILRPAQIYGDDDRFRPHQPLLYTIMDRAQRGEDIVLYGSNDARRNYIHAEDLACVIAEIVRHRVEGSYNCVGPEDVRVSELAAAAISAFGSSSTVRFDPARPNIVDNLFAIDESLHRAIEYRPRISLTEGLARQAARRRTTR